VGYSLVERAAGTNEQKRNNFSRYVQKINGRKINVDSFVSTTSKIIASQVHASKLWAILRSPFFLLQYKLL
jgi:hypothetical protein